jgi:anoctamin-1
VLVWDESSPTQASQSSVDKRKTFEKNLIKEGLELEKVSGPGVPLHVIKIHAPDEILRRYAEILKLRMPMKLVIFYNYIQNQINYNYF